MWWGWWWRQCCSTHINLVSILVNLTLVNPSGLVYPCLVKSFLPKILGDLKFYLWVWQPSPAFYLNPGDAVSHGGGGSDGFSSNILSLLALLLVSSSRGSILVKFLEGDRFPLVHQLFKMFMFQANISLRMPSGRGQVSSCSAVFSRCSCSKPVSLRMSILWLSGHIYLTCAQLNIIGPPLHGAHYY